jgi:hypothetical protein
MSTERAKEAARKWLREQAGNQRFSGDFRPDHVASLADLLDSVRLDEAQWWNQTWGAKIRAKTRANRLIELEAALEATTKGTP